MTAVIAKTTSTTAVRIVSAAASACNVAARTAHVIRPTTTREP